jgi:hypothetical protein
MQPHTWPSGKMQGELDAWQNINHATREGLVNLMKVDYPSDL